MPTFSVIVPTYNRADFVARAISSILEQEVQGGAEAIVVDDASIDDTEALVTRAFGPRVRYLRQPENRREGAARNAGAAHATGTYLAFLDSDDFYLPGKLAADLARFDATDRPAAVYSRARNVDPAGRNLGVRRLAAPQGDIFWQLARENIIPMSTVAVRADVFRARGGFVEDVALSGTADWELWMRIAARDRWGFTDHAATCIRMHPASMLGNQAWMERAMLAGLRHVLNDDAVARRLRGRVGWLRAHLYVTIALSAYRNGFRSSAARWLAKAGLAWPPVLVDARFLGATVRVASGWRPVGVST